MAIDQMDEIYQGARQQATRGLLRPSDVPAFLKGYFKNLSLTSLAGIVELHAKDQNYVFPGMGLLWNQPGLPYVPVDSMARFEVGRLTSIMRRVFDDCAEADDLQNLTLKRGQELTDLMYRVGLGAYV